jgi:hypothetical protein
MTKKILIIAAAALLLAGYGFGEVTFDKSFVKPDLSLIKNTYKAKLPKMSSSRADVIVRNIRGLTGEPMVLDNERSNKNFQFYRTIDKLTTCKIDLQTGDIFYRKHVKFKGSAPNLPKKGIKALAKNYLQILGLYKREMSKCKPHISTLNEAVTNGRTTKTFEKMRVVTFTRKLGGIPVLGASRAAVMFGADGDMVGLIVRWMDVKPVNVEGKVLPIRQIKRRIRSEFRARKLNVIVKKAKLIMFDDGKGTMKPMLHIEGDLVTSQGKFFSDWMFPVTE